MDYEKLLEKAEKELPQKAEGGARSLLENVKGHLEGNKTILINLKQISKQLNREMDHLMKYLLKELATPGKVAGDRVILGAKFPAKLINKKIKKYETEFVLCSECHKPDTLLVETEGIMYLKCTACGAKKPVKQLR